MEWKIIKREKGSAAENMAFDADLLANLDAYQTPILHLYNWERESITHGHFIEPSTWLNIEEIEKRGIDIARRPTGGGVVFHACDLAFSVFVPASYSAFSHNTLENYAFVNNMVIEVVKRFLGDQAISLLSQEPLAQNEACKHFCMAKPTKYDVMFEGKKVAGAAQRRTRLGYCHQGSIFLSLLNEETLESLLSPKSKVGAAMMANTFPLLGADCDSTSLHEGRERLKKLLVKVFQEWEG